MTASTCHRDTAARGKLRAWHHASSTARPALKEVVGEHVGYSDWVEITQEQVNQFAEATGDHQWIHIDVERAKKESPFGGPIAHGYLTLSLVPVLLPAGAGADRVQDGRQLRLQQGPLHVAGAGRREAPPRRQGARASTTSPAASRSTLEVTFECEGASKPSCVAEVIYRQYE